jgi:glutamate synthase domain-containing protein 3
MVDLIPVSASATRMTAPVVRSSAGMTSTIWHGRHAAPRRGTPAHLLERHHLYTGSKRARDSRQLGRRGEALVKVMPRDYARALRQMEAERLAAANVAAE